MSVNTGWEEYYRETDAVKRRDLLAELRKINQDEYDGLRAALFDLRYEMIKRPPYLADRFLSYAMELLSIGQGRQSPNARRTQKIKDILANMGAELAARSGEEGEEILYDEYCHAVRLYFICADKSGYKTFFGLIPGSDNYKHSKMLEDAVSMSRAVAERYGLTEEMKVWCRAVRDVYSSFGSGYSVEFDNY